MFCTMSRVSGSIEIGPRGLSHFIPFMASTSNVAVGLAARLLQRLIDQVDAIVAADRHETRARTEHLSVGRNESLVLRRIVGRRIHVRGDRTERGVAHVVQEIVVHDVAGTDDPDSGSAETALGKLLHEVPALTSGNEHVQRIRFGVLDALQKRREIRIDQRNLELLDDLAAAGEKAGFEELKGVIAGRVVGGQCRDLPDSVLGSPVADDHRRLCQGEAGAVSAPAWRAALRQVRPA